MRIGALLVLTGTLAACGGGGGGGGESTPPAPQQQSPDQIYTGRRTQVEIFEGNHATVADSAWYGPLTAFVLAQDVITDELPDGPVDEMITGSGGGTARFRGTISGGVGSLTIDYTSFTEDGTTLQGSETLTILTRRTPESGSVRRNFRALSVRSADMNLTLDGSLTRTDSTTSRFLASQWDISGDLVLTQAGSTAQKRIAALSLQRTLQAPDDFHVFSTLTGSARMYDSVLGYVDVSFETPIQFVPGTPEADPAPGGSLGVNGANNSKLWVSPLSNAYVAVELGSQGEKPTRSIVYRWDEAFDRAASLDRTEPLAIAGPDLNLNYARAGAPVPLEGRFSEGANGAFVTQQWTLMLSPPGSHATVSDTHTTRPTLLPDVEGAYMLRLRAADSTGSSTDFIGVYAAAPDSAPTPYFVDTRRALPPYLKADANALVNLDGGRTYMTDGSPLQSPNWQVTRNSDGANVASGTLTTEFVAQSEEDYLAIFMGGFQLAGPLGAAYEVWVTTPGNVRFAPVVGLDTVNAPRGTTPFVVADIDGNGAPDVVERVDPGVPAAAEMRVLLNRGSGTFEWNATSFAGGTSFPTEAAALPVDVNGDQRLDVIVPDDTGVGVFTQTQASPLNFAYTLLQRAVNCGGFEPNAPRSIVVLDVDRDGRKDIVSETACNANRPLELYINDPQSSGGFSPAVALVAPTTQPMYRLAAADVDNDGHDDLLGVTSTDGTINLMIWRNLPGGQFEAIPALTFTATQVTSLTPLIVADLNADGRNDIVFLGNAGVEVALGSAAGTFTLLTAAPLPNFYLAKRATIVDLDRDGLLDIATDTAWLRQRPNNEFARARRYAAMIGPSSVADMNGDGIPDLVSYNGPQIALGFE